MSHLEILTGRLQALLAGLRMLYDSLGMALGLCTLLLALFAIDEGDWIPLLVLVTGIGVPVAGILLVPLGPYGESIGTGILVLGMAVTSWLLASH